ncbi:hypothetical protein D1BOALGB6SA_2478 [Olavius sp. associated proteobacterium Delta 1]|nr:hypothetical protein D1BOALGB6SA_2478 [Olavius sp. associated proteobacterium Delta 1]
MLTLVKPETILNNENVITSMRSKSVSKNGKIQFWKPLQYFL